MNENDSNSTITSYLWMLYPSLLFLLGFIAERFSIDTHNRIMVAKIFYAFGAGIGFFIIPGIIIWISRFTKWKMSEREKLILCYGCSIVFFLLSI